MPVRKTPLVNSEVYHLFNRGVEYRPVFSTVYDHRRFLKTINFYRFFSPPVKLSQFLDFSRQKRTDLLKKLAKDKKDQVSIFSF